MYTDFKEGLLCAYRGAYVYMYIRIYILAQALGLVKEWISESFWGKTTTRESQNEQ